MPLRSGLVESESLLSVPDNVALRDQRVQPEENRTAEQRPYSRGVVLF